MKVHHADNVLLHQTSHPWAIASCILVGLGLLAVAVFWFRKCNIYPNTYQKKDDEVVEEEPATIGHERFYQQRSRSTKYKPRRSRSRSASELINQQHSNELFKCGKSHSIDSRTELYNLFRKRTTSVPRHEYSALSLENTQQQQQHQQCDQSNIKFSSENMQTCQQCLNDSGRYQLLNELKNIGSRPDKQWFLVKDKKLDAERLLTIVEIPSHSPISKQSIEKSNTGTSTSTTRDILLELFRSLHHPYIHPILDIEFWNSNRSAAIITPLNFFGSLKDIIYGTSWNDFYDNKYKMRGQGLPLKQVRYLGRQILEALHFLRTRHFPILYHLHSSNVIIQNGVARLSGYENTLLGLPPKPPAVNETLAFGYLLFEMITGYELPTPPNTSLLMIELERYPQLSNVIFSIFDARADDEQQQPPTIEELLCSEAFRGVELREMQRTTGITYTTSYDVSQLLESVRNSQMHTTIYYKSDVVEKLEHRLIEEVVEEQLSKAEEETLTVVLQNR